MTGTEALLLSTSGSSFTKAAGDVHVDIVKEEIYSRLPYSYFPFMRFKGAHMEMKDDDDGTNF